MSKRKRKVRNKGMDAPVKAPRNPLFDHPLMKKSHVHDKSHKAKRRAEKVRFARDWYSQSGFCIFNIKSVLRMLVPSSINTVTDTARI